MPLKEPTFLMKLCNEFREASLQELGKIYVILVYK
jgi:hypothetical protein